MAKLNHLLLLLLFPATSFAEMSDAADINSISSMLLNGGYLAGIILVISALYGFYQWGANKQGKSLSYPLMYLLAGTCLLISLGLYDYVKVSTIDPNWSGHSNPLAIDQSALDEGLGDGFMSRMSPKLQSSLVGFLMLLGIYSYLKALYLLKNIGGPPPPGGGGWASRILSHMIAGMILINVQTVSCGLFSWMGFTYLCGG